MTEPTPEESLKKLALMVPSPDEPDGLAVADSSAPAIHEQTFASAGGPAPPLHAFVVDDDKPGKKKPPARKPNGAEGGAAKREVQRMLPAAVRVHVYKTNKVGKKSFVGDYSANDLSAQGTIERFLHEYVVPEFEYGEYALYMQQPGKPELDPIGSVNIEEPLSHRRRRDGNGNGNETKELIELFAKQSAASQAAAANQKDPLEQMRETLTFLETMRGSGEKEGRSSMDPMMMMLFMNMMKPAPVMPSGPDPILLKIIDRIERMEDQSNAMAMLPPPPPPMPPPVDPVASISPLLQMMMAQQKQTTDLLIASMTNKNNPVEDLARLSAITGATDDRMTTKDLLTMLPTLTNMLAPSRERGGLAEALETMRSVKMLEREFGSGQTDQSASSFWDFLRDFVTSDAGARIADAVMARDAAKKVDERQQTRKLAAENQAQQPAAPAEEEGGELVIPDSFREKHAVAINTASTPSDRLEALIRAFQHLGSYPEFRPFMAKIIGLMKENRKVECLDFVARFLESMIDAGALEPEPCQKALDDLKEYWSLVRQQLKMPDTAEVLPEGEESDEDPEPERHLRAVPDADEDEDENEEIDPPRAAPRRSQRDVVPLEPTPEQVSASEALERARAAERELAPVPG